MTVYAVKDAGRVEADRNQMRSWWVHFAVALAATVGALLVLIFNGIAERDFMPRNLQSLCVLMAIGCWTLFYIRRAETRVADAIRQDGIEREDRIAALGIMIADIRRKQDALRDIIDARRKQDGFAEGWLAASNETPEIPSGHSTVHLKVVP